MLKYFLLQSISTVLIVGSLAYLVIQTKGIKKMKQSFKKVGPEKRIAFFVIMGSLALMLYSRAPYPIHFAMPPMMHSYAPGQMPSSIPIGNILEFFKQISQFEKIEDIGTDPNAVPQSLLNSDPLKKIKIPEKVEISLTAKEVISEVAPEIYINYWTYNGQVPGPMLRVREGDTIELSLTNDPSSLHSHNIDLHAVTGPGGGAPLTQVAPGETKSFEWKALNPGLYVYHCATPNVSTHNAHGQYGLILVEPKEGLPSVDHEFYVVQGELYTEGGLGKKGLMVFDAQALLDGNPTYITFNGKVQTQEPSMQVKVGDRVRIFLGNGGVNTISSFHIIGEIFDTVYPEGAIGSTPFKNVQTTAILPGGSSIVEFTTEVPGKYLLVDHALARLNKGAWMLLEVLPKDS